MPKIIINTTYLDFQHWVPNPQLMDDYMEQLENLLMDALLQEFADLHIPITDRTDLEVSWPCITRARNAANISIEVYFSQQDEASSPGLRKLTAEERVRMRNNLLKVLSETPLLPDSFMVAVWIIPATGGAFAMACHKTQSTKKSGS